MYTLLVNENNEIITTVRERIMQRSKLVDNLHILADKMYKGHDMSTFTVMLEYMLPVSREYKNETLVMSEELYKDKIEFKLPFDTCLTKEAGKIEIQLTFIKVEMDTDGNVIQRVRKAGPAAITIIPVTAWSNVIPDDALTAIDQRLIMAEAMINAANEFNQYMYETKADNIVYNKDANELWLTANGTQIGNKIKLNSVIGDGGIKAIRISDNNELIVIYANGTEEVVGKINTSDSGIYIPNYTQDGMLVYTLSDMPGDETLSFDINPFNNWNTLGGPEVKTTYVWQQL